MFYTRFAFSFVYLQRLISGFAAYHSECYNLMKEHQYFPIEVDLARSAFQYGLPSSFQVGVQRQNSNVFFNVVPLSFHSGVI